MKLLSFLATLLLATTALGSTPQDTIPAGPTLQNVYARQMTSLNGEWQTIVDPTDAGYYDFWRRVMKNGFFKNEKPHTGYDHVEYDFSPAETLHVPSDWNTQRPELFFYESTVWYKRDFTYQLPPGRRLYLYFGGANYETEAWLNGEALGQHEGGFTPFLFDITDHVRQGDNFVVVRVNSARRADGVPTLNCDWWNYGGLTRDVMLVETPEVSIDDYSIQLVRGRYDRIEASVQLNRPVAGVSVALNIPELKIRQTLTTNADGRAAIELKAKPQLWSPEHPRLYHVELVQGDERISDDIGFRHIETRGREVLLNGQPVFLRGISIHEEAPFRTGRCTTAADDSTLLSWAQELGCNFLRLAHYPHNEQMVRMAERMGFMLWSEVPVYWSIHWDDPDTYRNASRQLQDNISRDHNRCAIIIWSVANETPKSEARHRFLRGLTEQVRQRDPERLVSMALLLDGTRNDTTYVSDPMNEYVDIISFNNYPGWYGDRYENLKTRQWNIPYNKPFFVSEFGGGSKAGYHGPTNQKWTEEYQAALYQATLDMYDRQPGWAGTSPWILMDFRSARRQLHGVQDFFNRKGIVSDQGQKKQAFYVLQQFYATKRGTATSGGEVTRSRHKKE